MAMNGDALGDAIKAAIDAETGLDRTELFRAMGNAIVNYLIFNLDVHVVNVNGVQPGGGVSGSGSGFVL